LGGCDWQSRRQDEGRPWQKHITTTEEVSSHPGEKGRMKAGIEAFAGGNVGETCLLVCFDLTRSVFEIRTIIAV
jgi:hypothetical protein